MCVGGRGERNGSRGEWEEADNIEIVVPKQPNITGQAGYVKSNLLSRGSTTLPKHELYPIVSRNLRGEGAKLLSQKWKGRGRVQNFNEWELAPRQIRSDSAEGKKENSNCTYCVPARLNLLSETPRYIKGGSSVGISRVSVSLNSRRLANESVDELSAVSRIVGPLYFFSSPFLLFFLLVRGAFFTKKCLSPAVEEIWMRGKGSPGLWAERRGGRWIWTQVARGGTYYSAAGVNNGNFDPATVTFLPASVRNSPLLPSLSPVLLWSYDVTWPLFAKRVGLPHFYRSRPARRAGWK